MKKLIPLLAILTSTAAYADWDATLDAAKGQTVYWNAWGGDERTNDFIEWVSEQTEALYGVKIEQVKLTDTAEAVNRVISEKAAGNNAEGSVDMIWINGPNFYNMKSADLLHGPFLQDLPNAQYLDLSEGSAAITDFTVPTEGYESPWRLAKFVFNYDSARIENPPRSMTEFAEWAKKNPGRLTHPIPTDFMGATFLKQALIELTENPELLQSAPSDENFAEVTAPFWNWYEAIKPNFWRAGESFPENQFAQQNLLNDGEVDFGVSFDPASTAAAIIEGKLPETARVFTPEIGAIGNISFVAIPYNAAHKEGAVVVANYLLSPEAQSHMQNIDVLGSFSVLDASKLGEKAARFEELPTAPALPTLEALGATLLEPHPEWMVKLVDEWSRRYTK